MKYFVLLVALFLTCLIPNTLYARARPQNDVRIRDNTNPNHRADVLQLNLNMPTSSWGLVTKTGNYFYDATGANWRYWNGIQAATNLTALPRAPFTLGLPYFYSITSTDLELWRGDPLDSDAIADTTEAPYTGSFGHFYDITNGNWRRFSGDELSSDSVPTTTISPYIGSFLHGHHSDDGLWERLKLTDHQDDLALSLHGLVTASVMYGYDGTTLDMLRVGASQELQVTDVATRPGEDSGNDWRKVKKEETAVYEPAGTTGTAVDDSAGGDVGDEVLASVYVENVVNFTISIKNAGGGSGDAIENCYILQSPNDTDWESLGTVGSCAGLASGSVCSYQLSNQSYAYVKAECICDTGDDTTVDAYLNGNKN